PDPRPQTLQAPGRAATTRPAPPPPSRTSPRLGDAQATDGPQATHQTRQGRLPPPQGHRRTRLRPDHHPPERTHPAPTRQGRSPRRVATPGRLPQPTQDLRPPRRWRAGHRHRLTHHRAGDRSAACQPTHAAPGRPPPAGPAAAEKVTPPAERTNPAYALLGHAPRAHGKATGSARKGSVTARRSSAMASRRTR